MTRNEIDITQQKEECFTTKESMFDGHWTKTTQFLNPMVDINLKNKIIMRYFKNMYLDDFGIEHQFERPIFILFKVADFQDPLWLKVYGAFTGSKHYVFDYDIGTQDGQNLVMVVFRAPDEFAPDYYHFKRGKYSQFSDKLKDRFPRFLAHPQTGEPQESIIWGVINKSRKLKELLEEEFGTPVHEWDKAEELWDLPRKEREYYRYTEGLP